MCKWKLFTPAVISKLGCDQVYTFLCILSVKCGFLEVSFGVQSYNIIYVAAL